MRLQARWGRFRAEHARTAAQVTRENSRRGYERLYRSRVRLEDYLREERLRFYEEVADVVASFAPASVVDVGCGSGHLLGAVAERLGGTPRLLGIDYARSAARRVRQLVPQAEVLVSDLYDLELEERFDLVLCTEVLEHVDEPVAALDALARLRGPCGRIVLTVPDGALDDWEGHQNFWNQDELRALLGRLGAVEIRRIDQDRTLLAVVAFG